MTDRGLPNVDGAQACPFVAFENDRDERATSPDHRHRCYAEARPAPRALAHQEAYCLSSAFPVCPTFQDWARREAAEARAGSGGVEPALGQEPSQRNPPRDWSAPPPWAGGVAGGAGAAAAAAAGAFDAEDDDREEDPPGFLSSRSAAAGAGLAGSTADRLAGSGRGDGDVTGDDSRYGPTGQPDQRPAIRLDPAADPDDDRFDQRADEPYDDSQGEDEFEPERRGRPRSARASGGIGFGRDRRPRVGATRRAQGWDDAGPSWERPRHNEPYPVLKSRRLPRLSRVAGMAIVLVIAAIAVFFLPQFLGLGGSPATGDRTSPRPGSAGPSVSLAPTPVPAPTPQIYIVKSGDSMFSIAKQFGLTPDELIAAPPPGGSPRPSPSA
jgi:hypothetical protein